MLWCLIGILSDQPHLSVLGASPLEMQAHAALDSCNGLPWKHLTLLYILAGSAFITALVAVNKTPEGELSMSGSDLYTKSICPFGDLTWGDEVFQFDDHHYQIIGSKDALVSWREAAMDANSRCYGGQPGYLANIDSEDENDYLYAKLSKKPHFSPNTHDAWIGATDMKNEGVFSWIGPKHLINGVKFWEGDKNGQAIDGRYTNWGQDTSGQSQPDSNGEEDCIEMRGASPGRWNDKNCYQPNEFFIVEFGTPATSTDH